MKHLKVSLNFKKYESLIYKYPSSITIHLFA